MATYSAYTTTTCSTTNKASLSSSSKTYTSKAGQSSTTRYIKNTLPISYQHNSLKTTSTITRCKPTSRYYASTCAPSLAEASRLERNFSYIEAMKESKSLPSSSNSSSTSTIESPPLNDTLQPHPEEVEIPIQIKLVAPMAKSRSQSSIFHLFRSTFSPFQMRKWRSKSRDKLLASASPSEALTSAHSDVSQTAQTNHCAPPQPDNNYSYTSSLSSSSSDSSYRHKSSPRLSPNASARQLSYLKLTCLLNGYDKYEFKDDKADSLKSIYLKSSKALCTDRYYDVKPGFRRYTSSARQPSACDHDAQVYKSELSVRLNVQEEKADGDAMAPDQNQHMTDELVVHNGKQEELTECNEEANTTDQAHVS
ncbi:hypothetical protein BpHYR1_022554 [Brachionus plicatilis]|uniref:Uncharacterized protein n=1 Tax=Brachionus plicatilis TaxID=10195 RepID=A0A3M7PYE7_BRAPC|nr:hypothetical protein BpHYR1_022554 [Brachionus plicatilis]